MKQQFDLGSAWITPDSPQTAGDWVTITYTYRAAHAMDDTGCLKIAFRFASDCGTPQWADPTAANYCAISTTADCRLEPRWDPKGNTRPWGKCLLLKVMKGYVKRGDTITVVFGDTASGSPGWQLPTFREDSFEFKTLVDPVATYLFKELPVSPTLAIMPGPADRAVCIAPSQVLAGQPFTWYLKLEDRWGNPVATPAPLRHAGFAEPGIETLQGEDAATGLSATSNPIRVLPADAEPDVFAPVLTPYWGDLHGQSEETIGTNTVVDYFRFARDCGLVDVAGHQGNDFQITEAFWALIQKTTREFDEPGRYVAFPGYEWSGNTPLGGDRNVFYEEEGGPIFRSCFDLLPGQEAIDPMAETADDLFAMLRVNDAQRPFCYAHVGGRYADIRMHDEDLEIAVEVHSAWGTFEWLINDALSLGYRVGIVANSDGHKGRPGASYPGASRFGSLGGLTCILAERLDRPAIVDALRRRHCYGTTGHRPLIDLSLVTADGETAMMGDILPSPATSAELRLHAVGTGPIQSISVRNGEEVLTVYRPYAAADLDRCVKIVWSGAQVRGRDRIVEWDGHLEIAGNRILAVSPVNFWNPDQQPRQTGDDRVDFRSITTGGVAGLILELAEPAVGKIHLHTRQGDVTVAIESLGVEPHVLEFGGLAMQVEVTRLPAELPSEIELELDLPLNPFDNPIYLRIDQLDGHMAWTSPIYIVRDNEYTTATLGDMDFPTFTV